MKVRALVAKMDGVPSLNGWAFAPRQHSDTG
jgi:hypothetical protein